MDNSTQRDIDIRCYPYDRLKIIARNAKEARLLEVTFKFYLVPTEEVWLSMMDYFDVQIFPQNFTLIYYSTESDRQMKILISNATFNSVELQHESKNIKCIISIYGHCPRFYLEEIIGAS